MNGGNDGIQALPLSAYCCISLQLSLKYVDQPKALVATES
jgi:hypothetical protein